MWGRMTQAIKLLCAPVTSVPMAGQGPMMWTSQEQGTVRAGAMWKGRCLGYPLGWQVVKGTAPPIVKVNVSVQTWALWLWAGNGIQSGILLSFPHCTGQCHCLPAQSGHQLSGAHLLRVGQWP